jgi:hypothetical protein
MKKVVLALFALGFVVAIVTVILDLGDNTTTNQNNQPVSSDENQVVSGISVEFTLYSNSKSIDEGILQANIKNSNNEAFRGTVTITGSPFMLWEIELGNLAPGTNVIRELKTTYIEPDSTFNYEAKGILFENNHVVGTDYKVIHRPPDTYAFYIQTEKVNKETAIDIVKDLYAEHGDNIRYIAIYDNSYELKDGEVPDPLPNAEHFFNLAETKKIITIRDSDGIEEKVDFDVE